MFLDELIINGVGSLEDYGASVKERKISAPAKKKIKETVPFSNETYDFSSINGEIYWEERTLEYVLEMDARTAEELESSKIAFRSWVMNVEKGELHDPYIKGYHFMATFDEIEFDDSEFEKTTISLVFTAYPFMIANEPKKYTKKVSSTQTTIESMCTVLNNSSHKLTPTFKASVPVSITIGGKTYSIAAGTFTDDSLELEVGSNLFTVKTTASSGTLEIEFTEEVF